MGIRRDSVNRVTKRIRLPIKLGGHIQVGSVITLANVQENDIFPNAMVEPAAIKDPMATFQQPNGNKYGDAIFDPMARDGIAIIGYADGADEVAIGRYVENLMEVFGVPAAANEVIFDPMGNQA